MKDITSVIFGAKLLANTVINVSYTTNEQYMNLNNKTQNVIN